MSAKKRVLENSFLYTFSRLLVRAIGFLLLPIYTLYMSPEDYGITNLVNSFLQVSIFIVAFSLNSGIVRFYVDYKNNHDMLKRFIGTILLFVTISSSVFVLLGLVFNNILITLFFEGLSFFPIVLITLITLIFLTLHNIHQNILQASQQGRRLTVINLVVFTTQVLLNILLIVFFKLGALGMLLSQFIVYILYFVFIILDLKKKNLFTVCLDLKILKEALKYSIPLMPHNLSTRIASFASRVFMNLNETISLVGLYSVAFQFANIIDTVQSSVNKAFQPWFFNMLNANVKDKRNEVVKLSYLLITLYSFVYMTIGLFSQEAIILMTNQDYVMAWTAIPILVVGFSIKSIYYFYVNILFYHKTAARKIFISTLAGSFADVLLAFILIPKLGMYGAALAFLIAKIIVVALVYLMSNKYNDIGYKIFDMLKIIITSLFFMSVGLYFSYTKYLTTFNLYNFFYKIFIFIVYFIYIFFMNRKNIELLLSGQQIRIYLSKFGRKK